MICQHREEIAHEIIEQFPVSLYRPGIGQDDNIERFEDAGTAVKTVLDPLLPIGPRPSPALVDRHDTALAFIEPDIVEPLRCFSCEHLKVYMEKGLKWNQ